VTSRPDLDRIARTFVPPPGFDRAIPREVSLTVAGRAVVTLAAVLFAAGVLVFPVLFVSARRAEVSPVWVPFVVSAALILLSVLCRLLVDRERRLAGEGRAAPAVVTGQFKQHSSHGGTHRYITYEYRLLSGAVRRGRMSVEKPPAVGSVICVLYDPNEPRRTSRCPMRLVRPAITSTGQRRAAVQSRELRPSRRKHEEGSADEREVS